MEMQFVISGIGLAFTAAIVGVVVVARRRRTESQARVVAEREAQRQTEEVRRCADEEARVAAGREAQRQADEEACAAAERETQRQAEEARRRADEHARVAEEREAQRSAAKEAQRRAEEASAAAEQECQAEEVARATAEREAQRRETEEAQRRAEDEARIAAEGEMQRRAAEEARRRAEEEARAAAERERQAKEEALAAAARDAKRQAEETCAAAQPEAPIETTPVREGTSSRGDEAENRPTQTARVGAAACDAGSGVMDTSPQVAPLSAQPLEPRAPRQYRPTARGPASLRAPASPSPERETRDRAIPIEVRLVFEKAGFCRVSLLPRRAAGMPIEFAVEGAGSPPELQALQDEWYQDVMLPEIGRLLSEGIEWAGALPGGATGRLSLSGRGIFVLARHGELNGFVTTPRLILGEEHVVLCVAERLPDVRAAIALTESPEPTELDSDSGVPAGWVGLRGVRPKKPVAPSPGGDIIDALRPLPDVEISLAGGIRIDRQTWLSGFPPTIELLGDASTLGVVTIDGQEATRSPEGGYVAPGWDSAGDHTVWCTSNSRKYAIRSAAEVWEPWDAYAWSLGEPTASGTQSRPAICGVLVRPPQVARSGSRPTVVAASNPILIGARPGEISVCTPRGDVRAGLCVGFPWFEPIWAIPADALHCDKRTARVLLIGSPVAVDRGDQSNRNDGGGAAQRRALASGSRVWCEAICAAGRKGLQTEPSRVEIADLWKGYKRYAKALRRASR